MLQILVNKSISLYYLANTNELGDSDSFLLYRAWNLSRRLVNLSMWALLHDVSVKLDNLAPKSKGAQRKGKVREYNVERDLRKLQLSLAESFWLGLAPKDSVVAFEPKDGRGHLLTQQNRQDLRHLLSASREKFAPMMVKYCERRTTNARKARLTW